MDFIKTRLLATNEYKGIVDCAMKCVKNEGVFVLFRGWTPAYMRIAPHFIIALPLFEALRTAMGLGHL